jgi:hypothetical protein
MGPWSRHDACDEDDDDGVYDDVESRQDNYPADGDDDVGDMGYNVGDDGDDDDNDDNDDDDDEGPSR